MKSRKSSERSLREQLRNEADAARRAAEAKESRAQADLAFYDEHLLPVMLRAAAYCEDAVDDLNAIGKEITALYPIGPSSGRDVAFRQGGYDVAVDNRAQPSRIAVTCTCEIKLPITRYITSIVEADGFEQHLREMGIEFYRRRQNDLSSGEPEKSRFAIEGSLIAGFTVAALPEQRAIEVLTRNLEPEPRRSHSLVPEKIDEELLESLLSLLLRQTDRLIGHEIDPEVKAWLREEAERHRKEREKINGEVSNSGVIARGVAITQQVKESTAPAIGASARRTRSLVRRFFSNDRGSNDAGER